MEKKTHWKQLVNPDYIGAYALAPNEEKTLTIKSVTREKVTGAGGKKQECTVIYFTENVKPMICNRTNAKTITKVCGTPYIEEWSGKKIVLYVEAVDAFGETVEALRVKPVVIDYELVNSYGEKLSNCNTQEELNMLYEVSPKSETNKPEIRSLFTKRKNEIA